VSIKRQRTSTEMADNWVAGMQSAATQKKFKDGINAYQGNPMAEAATDSAMQRYQDGVALSITSGYRKTKLLAASPTDWKLTTTTIGAANLGAGALKKKKKYQAAMDKWAAEYHNASVNAAAATGVQSKIMAAINTLRRAAGKPEL